MGAYINKFSIHFDVDSRTLCSGCIEIMGYSNFGNSL